MSNTTKPPLDQPHYALDDESTKALVSRLFPNHPTPAQTAEFFAVLGRAVTCWQLVETALYELYERVLGPRRPGACGAGFHAIQTFTGKLAAVDAAFSFALQDNPEVLTEWKNLRKYADKKSQRRNMFVHFATYTYFDEQPVNKKIRLEPPVHDYRLLGADRPALGLAEIRDITDKFIELANELVRFRSKISEAPNR